jgi:hypothetical protein
MERGKLPDVSAMLREDRRPSGPARWLVLVVAGLAVVLLLGFGLSSRLRRLTSRGEDPGPSLVEAAKDVAAASRAWSRAETIAPSGDRVDPATGEVTAPFQGFAVSVDSEPEGARVLVDGVEVGETPIVASVGCSPGVSVEVRVEKRPYRARRLVTSCRADTLVRLSATLAR